MTRYGTKEVDEHFTITLARGVQILQAFSSEKATLTNGELVTLTGMDKATVSRLAFTLIELGYLRREGLRGGYSLDTGVLTLGYPLLASMHIRQVARPWMHNLSEHMDGTVSLCVRDRSSIIYLDSVRKIDSNTPSVDIGSSLPLVASAAGRAWLCSVSEAQRTAALNQIRLQTPAVFEANQKEIEKTKSQMQRHGFSINRGAHDARRVAVAVPMCKLLHGELIVFNCSLLADESLRLAKAREAGYALRDMVRHIEVAIGMRTLDNE